MPRDPHIIREQATEAEFQAAVVQSAKLRGWWAYHTHDSRRSEAGFPDLVLLRGVHGRGHRYGRCIVAELKVRGRQATPEQRHVLWLFGQVPNIEVHHWTPRDWDAIERTLA
jgi:hypothetical protein